VTTVESSISRNMPEHAPVSVHHGRVASVRWIFRDTGA
jgi:hypothetical protein